MLEGSHLAMLGFAMVTTIMVFIMTRTLSAMVALILIPTVFAIAGGYTLSMGPMMMDGVRKLAPTGIMLMFAILYFSIMNDIGLFNPLIRFILKLAKGDPLKVLLGTAVLSLLVSLDGDGATTYIIVLTAMVPLYQRLGMNRLFLSCVVMLAAGVTNLVPWGGPTARAASALHLEPARLFLPMLPALLGCDVWVILSACIMGLLERKRLGTLSTPEALEQSNSNHQHSASPSRHLFLNSLMTVVLILLLIQGHLPMSILFILGCGLALLLNYPNLTEQKNQIGKHAPNILFVVSLIFAAGMFTGILSGTKMVDAMSQSILQFIPDAAGPHLSVLTGLISIPMTFFISNDAFYFGMLPILAKVGQTYGLSAAEIGRAAMIGQPVHLLSPLVPSTYLLVNMADVDFGSHQKFTLTWALVSCAVLLGIGCLIAAIPI